MTDGSGLERREIELGFMFDHSMLGETSRQALNAAASALAIGELLVEHGVLDHTELERRREAVTEDLQKQVEERGVGVFINPGDSDKYRISDLPEINCAERLHLCRAACCALPFPLSRQDVEEGVVRWDFGRPYWVQQGTDGYCVHNDPETGQCGVYAQRPGPCRRYDCRNDKRIWVDFDGMVVNPDLLASQGPQPIRISGTRRPR